MVFRSMQIDIENTHAQSSKAWYNWMVLILPRKPNGFDFKMMNNDERQLNQYTKREN